MFRGIATLLAFVLVAAPAQAFLLEDATGDVVADHCGESETPVSGWDTMDIIGVDIVEDPQGFQFIVTSSLITRDEQRQDYGNFFVWFTHGGVVYTVRMYQANDNGAPFAHFEQTGQTGRVFGSWVDSLDTALDTGTNQQFAYVPRGVILNEDGRAPEKGDNFTDIHAASSAHGTGIYTCFGVGEGGPAIIGDEVDGWNLGSGPSFAVQFGGGESSGPVTLEVDRPFRASNGEGTTFRFEVRLQNDADTARVFELKNRSLPSNWQLSAGGTLLEIPGGGGASFPVFLTVPFAHQHGAVVAFDLILEAADDPDVWASRQLGVHYHSIPQPAGHHDTLWFHSRAWSDIAETVNPVVGGTNGVLSMSTLETDPGDDKTPIRGDTNLNPEGLFYRWEVCLVPELLMGLDFDLSRDGDLILNLATTRPVEGELTGELVWIGPGEDPQWCSVSGHAQREQKVLGTIEATPVTMGPSSAIQVQAAFKPTSAADRVRPVEGADMMLKLILQDVPGPFGAGGVDVMPGSSLQLPLHEYHEATSADVPTPENPVDEDPEDVFIEDAPVAESPLPLAPLLLACLGLVGIRRRFPPA